MNARGLLLLGLTAAAPLAACSHADFDPVPAATSTAAASPTPSPGASSSAAPQACGTAAPGAVLIAAGSYIEPPATPDATYGTTYGYALVASDGSYPLVSAPILLRAGDVVQFTNVDPPANDGSNGAPHSAAGFTGNAFPTTPFAFPANEQSAAGSTLSSTAPWSTGQIASLSAALCYSQTLAVPASGAFYFGDLTDYAATNMRGVIAVSATAAR